jgi:alkylation response protein AidB-like acyl-CoA dehydrogenase
MQPRNGPGVLAAIERIAPVIREEAAPSDGARRATPRLVEALNAERLFRLWIPRSLAGDELDLPASLGAFEAVSRLDGSAGWTVMIGVGGGLFAAFMDEAGARDVFARPDALIAGSGSPRGRAAAVEGGYLAGGEWQYASGAHQATTFTANCFVERDGQPLREAGGAPLIRAMAFPAESVEIIPNWEVLRMRGTGSHDFRVAPVFVPAKHTFSVFTDAPREPGPLYRFPFTSIAEVSFASVALGIGAHALDAFDGLAAGKMVYGTDQPLAGHAGARLAAADAFATLASARTWFYDVAREAWAVVRRGRTLDEREAADVRLASIHAGRASARAADLVFEMARTSVIRDGDELGRAWRDVHVVRQHAALSPTGLGERGLRATPARPAVGGP